MTRQELEWLKAVLCPHDADYAYPCISPEYLECELEELFVMMPGQTEDARSDLQEVLRLEWIDISLVAQTNELGEEELIVNCELPNDGETIVVTDGKKAWHDVFHILDGRGVLESGFIFGGDVIAWKREEGDA